ncbi:MAG: DUF1634 domain-containing protein [Vicinamibacterales bacterium]
MSSQPPASGDARRAADEPMEQRLGAILHGGVVASTTVLAIGLLCTLLFDAPTLANGFLTTGLLLLLATPVARVATSVVQYARQRDWLFATLTGLVLIELLAGVVAALLFHRRL